MSLIAATLMTLVAGQWPDTAEWVKRNELPLYAPAVHIKALDRIQPTSIIVSKNSSVRGYRPIVSYWVLKEPIEKVAMKLRGDMLWLDNDATETQIRRRGRLQCMRILPDRVITAWVEAGRPVHDKSSYRYADQELYTRIELRERPLFLGPLPRSWPKKAMRAPIVPKGFPSLPFKGVSSPAYAWSKSMTPTGADNYFVRFYVKESPETFLDKVERQMKANAEWRYMRDDQPQTLRLTPIWPVSTFAWISVESSRGPLNEFSNAGWTEVTASWCDPETGLFKTVGKSRTGGG